MKFLVFILAIIAVRSAVIHPLAEYEMPEIRAVDFITGFLEGLNEKGDVNKLLECIRDIDKIIDDVIEGFELILTKKAENVIIGVTKIIGAVRELLKKISPCSEGFKQILKLIEAFKDIDIIKIALKLLKDPKLYLTDIIKAVEAFKNKNFREGGKRVGSFLYKLFLVKGTMVPPKDNIFNIILQTIKGFLTGLNSGSDLQEIFECVNNLSTIVSSIKEIIEKFRDVDWKNRESVVAIIHSLVDCLKFILNSIIPCYESKKNAVDLWEKIKNIDFKKRLQKLPSEIFNLIHYITLAGQHLKEMEYNSFGDDIGNVFFIVLFKP